MLMKGSELPDADSKLLRDSKLRKLFARETCEAFRQGTKGPAYEAKLYAKPWGFNLKDISPKLKVYLYHGELDVNVPIKMGRAMAEAIPNCKATFYAEEAHLSTAMNHLEEIMKTVIS
jgi:pimeloyl-ACP methyl ester carboxylesterase